MTRVEGPALRQTAVRAEKGESRGESFGAHLSAVANAPDHTAKRAPERPRGDETGPGSTVPGDPRAAERATVSVAVATSEEGYAQAGLQQVALDMPSNRAPRGAVDTPVAPGMASHDPAAGAASRAPAPAVATGRTSGSQGEAGETRPSTGDAAHGASARVTVGAAKDIASAATGAPQNDAAGERGAPTGNTPGATPIQSGRDPGGHPTLPPESAAIARRNSQGGLGSPEAAARAGEQTAPAPGTRDGTAAPGTTDPARTVTRPAEGAAYPSAGARADTSAGAAPPGGASSAASSSPDARMEATVDAAALNDPRAAQHARDLAQGMGMRSDNASLRDVAPVRTARMVSAPVERHALAVTPERPATTIPAAPVTRGETASSDGAPNAALGKSAQPDPLAAAPAPIGGASQAAATPRSKTGPETALSSPATAGTPTGPAPAPIVPPTMSDRAQLLSAEMLVPVARSAPSGMTGGVAPTLPGTFGAIDVQAPGWAARFVQEVRLARAGSARDHELVLQPERLGRVQVRFELNDGSVGVRILTETPEAARLFAEAQPRLAEAFGRAGLDLAQHQAESFAQTSGEQQPRHGERGARGPQGQGAEWAAANEEEPLRTPDAPRRSGIDLIA